MPEKQAIAVGVLDHEASDAISASLATDSQTQPQQDEQPANRSRQHAPSSRVAKEESAQPTGGHCQDEAPQGTSGDECQPKRNERRDLGVAVAIDELRHQREKEECDLRIERVGQDAVAKRIIYLTNPLSRAENGCT